ncbi:MAG: DUF1801 domain-containing protein [Bacteroidota bacterium]
MKTVEDFLYDREGKQREILFALREFFMGFPAIQEKLRYGIPFFYRHSWICYLSPKKGDWIELVFLHGQEFSNEQGLLVAGERKMVSGIPIYTVKEIPWQGLEEIWQEALIIDQFKWEQKKIR